MTNILKNTWNGQLWQEYYCYSIWREIFNTGLPWPNKFPHKVLLFSSLVQKSHQVIGNATLIYIKYSCIRDFSLLTLFFIFNLNFVNWSIIYIKMSAPHINIYLNNFHKINWSIFIVLIWEITICVWQWWPLSPSLLKLSYNDSQHITTSSFSLDFSWLCFVLSQFYKVIIDI